MEKREKLLAIIFVLVFVAFVCYVVINGNSNRDKNLTYDFDGIVEKVTYDIKGIPNVIIDGKSYYLSAGYNFNHEIEKNDSLIKRSGSNIYTLIKHKSGIEMNFEN